MAHAANGPDPGPIMQLGLGFWASKTMLSAIEMGVFTELGSGPEGFDALSGRLGLHERSARDFLTPWWRSGCSSATATATPTRRRRTSSSTGTSRHTSAACSRWPTPASTASGAR